LELTARIENLESEIERLKAKISALEKITEQRDDAALTEFVEQNRLISNFQRETKTEKPKSKKELEIGSGVRRYRSSDGLEILVGRAAKDNDRLTFRIAKSLDWWMHAADYPGSHVLVRNPSRKDELPPKTLIEAAELAAKFSQARTDSKVAVNYTQRKFVSKPKNAAPGLVRLASFRTILVEPKESGERILN
jgi:predicted ribosome quality control (RQC) complex YloA/Tae2 family protein